MRRAVIALVALGTFLAACGGGTSALEDEVTTTVPPTTTTTEATTTTVAETTTTTAAPIADAEAAYIEFTKNASFYEGETDAEIAEQGKFGCALFTDTTIDEFIALAESETGYIATAEELEGIRLMAAAYCPEAL